MNKIVGWIIVALVILVGGFFALNAYIYDEKQGDQMPAITYKDATYVIEGRAVTLTGGFAETEVVPGSASKIVTRYFGNELAGDFDGDGDADVAFILTQETGGSGIFYYIVAALATDDGYVGSQAFFLGDRIAPQTTESGTGRNIVIVNYADRAPGESFEVAPSVGTTIQLSFDTQAMRFDEVSP